MEVIFEKENLHTFDPKCEVMLTIMSSLAQEESRSISENVRWGKRKSMQDGNVYMAYARFLGYRKGADGRPEIVEEEAVIVREIYQMYLDGRSIRDIADSLTKREIPTPSGKTQWSVSTVKSILSNEKYRGDALLQKTYTVDYLTKEVRKNEGEMRQYLVENSHDPIINPDTFDQVQVLLQQNQRRRAKVRTEHPFAGKIICGKCGEFYGHKVWRIRSTGERYDVWYCNHKYDGAFHCETPYFKETDILAAFEKAMTKYGKCQETVSIASWEKWVQSVVAKENGCLKFILTDGNEVEIAL